MTEATPSDQDVHSGITSALARLTTVEHIRPNKLRKTVCKETGATWTQFQTCLKDMIERGQLKTSKVNNEEVVLVENSMSAPEEETDSKEKADQRRYKNITKELTLEIPLAVAHHLTRKGRRKQKNIEQATKTKLTMTGLEDAKKHGDMVSLKVNQEYQIDTFEGDDAINEAKGKASKQLKAAKLLVENMIKSYQAHPDRYTAKKCGGTFAEQEKAKQLKDEGAKRFAEKHKRSVDTDEKNNDAEGKEARKQKKKKKRKFF